MVAHPCNPNYSGGRDPEDCNSRPAQAKCSQNPILTNKYLGRVACICCAGGINVRIEVQASLGRNSDPIQKDN
jgi:hypothetical protein